MNTGVEKDSAWMKGTLSPGTLKPVPTDRSIPIKLRDHLKADDTADPTRSDYLFGFENVFPVAKIFRNCDLLPALASLFHDVKGLFRRCSKRFFHHHVLSALDGIDDNCGSIDNGHCNENRLHVRGLKQRLMVIVHSRRHVQRETLSGRPMAVCNTLNSHLALYLLQDWPVQVSHSRSDANDS
jgi:hypothetical protein